jgi:hypothetical protein
MKCITTLIRHFEAWFPVTYADYKPNKNNWITRGIKTSCNKKESFTSYTGMIKTMLR